MAQKKCRRCAKWKHNYRRTVDGYYICDKCYWNEQKIISKLNQGK